MSNHEQHKMSWDIAKRIHDAKVLSDDEFSLLCWHFGLNAKDF